MVNIIFGGIIFWLFSAGVVFAVDFTLENVPAEIFLSAEISPVVNFSCSGCGDSYFRGVFFSGGTTDYFGFTKGNGGDWINTTGDKTQYFKIAKDELIAGSWSGQLIFKPDPEDVHYQGPGNYQFKLGRYTSANSSAVWSDPVSITLLGPSPTPTPVPTSAPTHTPKPDPPTHTPKPPTSTPVQPIKPTAKPSPKLYPSVTSITLITPITPLSSTPTKIISTPIILGTTTIPKPPSPSIFILASGCLFCIGSALLLFRS